MAGIVNGPSSEIQREGLQKGSRNPLKVTIMRAADAIKKLEIQTPWVRERMENTGR